MSRILELSDFESEFWEDPLFYHEETLADIFHNCAILSVVSIVPIVLKLVVLNTIFGILVSSALFSTNLLHIISGSIGIYLISSLESESGRYVLIGCFICSYLLIVVSCFVNKHLKVRSSNFVMVFVVPWLIVCEYYLLGPEVWSEIRGLIMVLIMKVVSLADDIEQTKKIPSKLEYFGYILCGANVFFGPWVSFDDYIALYCKSRKKDVNWILSIFWALAKSVVFLTLSNCWIGYFITEDANRFLVGFKEAFAFRTSHYFICYLSEVGMISAGFTSSQKMSDDVVQWRYVVTEPLEIEFPTSLAMVVKKWNQPMHDFLKKYVYRSLLNYGKFAAVLVTFIMSSFLHGLEVKVSTVLVTIGVFSYIQVVTRDKISRVLDCCVKVRACKMCEHKFKRSDVRCKLILFVHSLATILCLIYLGILMDPSTEIEGIFGKWQHLYYLGHIVIFGSASIFL